MDRFKKSRTRFPEIADRYAGLTDHFIFWYFRRIPMGGVASQFDVLLVCHNRSGLAARKAVLEEVGCHVSPAVTAEDALECFPKGNCDLLITDYRIGKLGGVDLINKLRAIKPDLPVIMLSGHVEALGLTEATTGADVVIAKGPNEVSSLVRAAARLLRQKTAKKPVRRERNGNRLNRRPARVS